MMEPEQFQFSMRQSSWQPPPVKLLLQLEWILLGIATIISLSPLSLAWRAQQIPEALPRQAMALRSSHLLLPIACWVCIILLGLMGRYLPLAAQTPPTAKSSASNSNAISFPLLPMAYIALGFIISWLTVIVWGRAGRLFPPLLLVVVIRGCQLFPWRGRWLVAVAALSSFMAQQYFTLNRWLPLIGPKRGFRLPPRSRGLPDELLRGIKLDAMLNASLLFALVLGFVLLLVGALLNEQRSRQQLAQANQQLRRYSLRIEDQATLQERSRIAREIHDSVGHCLTAQSIQLENVTLQLGKGAPDLLQAHHHLNAARKLGRDALQSVRQAVSRLRTHPLQGQSLDQAIATLIQEFQQHSSIPLTAEIDLPHFCPQDVGIVVYRILQEGLTNLTKHSQASQAQLYLQGRPHSIQLRLSDNGRGFDPQQNTTGFGLQSMAERVAAVQGQFQLVSAPGQGCRLELEVPL